MFSLYLYDSHDSTFKKNPLNLRFNMYSKNLCELFKCDEFRLDVHLCEAGTLICIMSIRIYVGDE